MDGANARSEAHPCMAHPIHFAGLRFDPVTLEETLKALDERPGFSPFSLFVTPNAEHSYFRMHDVEFDEASENCWLSTCDSRIIMRLARLAGIALPFAPGAYIIRDMFSGIVRPDDDLTIIGSTLQTVDLLRTRYGLPRIHQHIPPMGAINDPRAVRDIIDFVAAHPARFVFICLGPPQSEKLGLRIQEDGRATGIGMCVGSSLTTLVGITPPAPDFMERNSLVWLYRLVKEPQRLWRRYLVRGMSGIGLGIRDIIRFRLGLGPAHMNSANKGR